MPSVGARGGGADAWCWRGLTRVREAASPGPGTSSTRAEFCDTNILVYAFDRTAGPKHERARGLVDRLDDQGSGGASVQVLQELFVTLTRKVTPPLAFDVARQIVADLLTWQIVEPTAADVLHA